MLIEKKEFAKKKTKKKFSFVHSYNSFLNNKKKILN